MAQRALTWLVAVDQQLLLLIGRIECSSLTWVMRTLTHLGDAEAWIGWTLLVSIAGGDVRLGVSVGSAALVATIASYPLKRIFKRRRPSSTQGPAFALIPDPDAFSFPSGHTCAAFSVATALAETGTLGVIFAALAGLIGISRIYLRAHYPLDVLAGGCLGAFTGTVVGQLAGC